MLRERARKNNDQLVRVLYDHLGPRNQPKKWPIEIGVLLVSKGSAGSTPAGVFTEVLFTCLL